MRVQVPPPALDNRRPQPPKCKINITFSKLRFTFVFA